MKSIYVSILVILAVGSNAKLTCDAPPIDVPEAWLDMTDGCVNKIRGQIQKEIDASITYLAMGAHFSQDTVNRPGFAEFFFKSASEEREHATKLIEYLLMRTKLQDVTKLIEVKIPTATFWKSGVEALEKALETEASVTRSIKDVIAKCEDDLTKTDEKNNDYHIVDYLTGVFLEEQYHGQRELAGKISTLKKMMKSSTSGALGEFLFDKQMLN